MCSRRKKGQVDISMFEESVTKVVGHLMRKADNVRKGQISPPDPMPLANEQRQVRDVVTADDACDLRRGSPPLKNNRSQIRMGEAHPPGFHDQMPQSGFNGFLQHGLVDLRVFLEENELGDVMENTSEEDLLLDIACPHASRHQPG